MSYISLGDKDKKEMLARIGVSSTAELFHPIPREIKLEKQLEVPSPLTEPELIHYFETAAQKNKFHTCVSFLGAGAYPHVIPYVVDYISSRGEFVSPYTPYQPEVSQGTLQVIFEFQTLVCQLSGMEIANASLYDGASGAAEAVLMAHRLKGRPKVLVAKTLHPQYKKTIQTYVKNLGIQIEEIGYSERGEVDFEHLERKLDDDTSAVVSQSPNFVGTVEDLKRLSELAHSHDALSIVVVAEAVSLGILEAPGELGADIVTGEGQSFGLPLSFGGPYLGFMTCRKEFVRQFPGRIAGQTKDVEGRRGFVLTLSTREQHIRREQATSNICTNQALCALRATIFLETLGGEGLRELAWQNIQKANYALERLSQVEGIRRRFNGNSFNEFVLEFSEGWSKVDNFLREKGVIGGLSLGTFYPELENCALICVTEMHKKEEIDRLVELMEEAI
ncbi:MAG: aminomethyl-transferring glycine dehydrogenase subunit GcvPA [Candidatus Aminicenantes bacterium]|nr:MAG: aminomethyl-transferring glycine dehydrogenase subunit GcvPA [Candidatus Aminicenantes bacterium]